LNSRGTARQKHDALLNADIAGMLMNEHEGDSFWDEELPIGRSAEAQANASVVITRNPSSCVIHPVARTSLTRIVSVMLAEAEESAKARYVVSQGRRPDRPPVHRGLREVGGQRTTAVHSYDAAEPRDAESSTPADSTDYEPQFSFPPVIPFRRRTHVTMPCLCPL